jgi:hypothetical protein
MAVATRQPGQRPICLAWRLSAGVVLVLGFANSANACPACFDAAAAYRAPYGVPVSFVLLGWMIAALCLRRRLQATEPADTVEAGSVSWRAVVRFFWLWLAAVLFGGFTITVHVWLHLLSVVWMIYLAVKVARAAARSVRPPATQLFLRLNVVALVISIVIAPAAYVRARQPQNMVASLGASHMPYVVTDVIASGVPAVPYLRADLEQSIREDGYVSNYRVSQACYALARIGGPEAEQTLKHIVTERVPVVGVGFGQWQTVACCSYAECARSRATPDLLKLFERSAGNDRRPILFAALCGLARTGDRKAVSFVLEHREEFWYGIPYDGRTGGAGGVGMRIAQYLILHRDPDLLISGPIYDTASYNFGLPFESGFRGTIPARSVNLNEIEDLWKQNAEQIRNEWEKLLPGE